MLQIWTTLAMRSPGNKKPGAVAGLIESVVMLLFALTANAQNHVISHVGPAFLSGNLSLHKPEARLA